MTWAADDDGSLRDREPTIATEHGQVPLWHGLFVPDADRIAEYETILGRARDRVFPLSWRAVFHPPGDDLSGSVPGFAVSRGGGIEHV